MSITIVVITNEKRKITHPGQIGTIEGELKIYAKKFKGSNYFVDQRSDDPTDGIFSPSSKVLIATRDQNQLNYLISELVKFQLELIFANSGAEALSYINSENPDVAILQPDIPIINGYKTAELIRNSKDLPNPEIPIILIKEGNHKSSPHVNQVIASDLPSNELLEMLEKLIGKVTSEEY